MMMYSHNKEYFIVTSHGWSASNWLAYSLNLHPQIVCSHSARNVLADYKDMQSNHNLRKHLQSLHQGYLERQTIPIDDSYDLIESFGPAKAYGSVHLYRLRDLPVLYEKYGPFKRTFKVINLIRHPITLVWSGYGQFQDLFRYDINELHWTLGKILQGSRDFVFELAQRYNNLYLGDFENLAFIGAACVLGSLRKDLNALEQVKRLRNIDFIGHIQMEQITTCGDDFKSLVDTLTDNKVFSDDKYLEVVFRTGKINQHKKDKIQIDALTRYQSLQAWQKEILNYYLQRFSLIQDYQKLGYSFRDIPLE